MDTHEQELLDTVREAMRADEVRLNIVRTFTPGRSAVRIESRAYGGRWRAIKTLIFPPQDDGLGGLLTMLAEMREGAEAVAR